MTELEKFEIIAEAFRIDTGLWPPGKDRPPSMGPYDPSETSKQFAEWCVLHARIISAMLESFERITEND